MIKEKNIETPNYMGSIIQGKYSHTYTVTASDITPL